MEMLLLVLCPELLENGLVLIALEHPAVSEQAHADIVHLLGAHLGDHPEHVAHVRRADEPFAAVDLLEGLPQPRPSLLEDVRHRVEEEGLVLLSNGLPDQHGQLALQPDEAEPREFVDVPELAVNQVVRELLGPVARQLEGPLRQPLLKVSVDDPFRVAFELLLD